MPASTRYALKWATRHRFRRSQEGAEYARAGGPGKVKEFMLGRTALFGLSPGDCGSTQPKDGRPSHMDWNSFIGPAPMRPIIRPTRRSSGVVGGITERVPSGMACHTTNLAFMACELTQPSLIESVNTGPINDFSFMGHINLHFPGGDKHGAIKFHWYEGKVGNNGKDNKGVKNLPPMELFHGQNPKNSGLLIVGSDGIMYSPNDYG